MHRVVAWGGLALATAGGCNAIFGVGDLTFDAVPSTTSDGGAGGSGGAMGGMGGMGGGPPLTYCEQAAAPDGPGADMLWTWPSDSRAVATAIATDAEGQVVVAIEFEGELAIEGRTTIADEADVVVVKQDLEGEVVWAQRITGAGDEIVRQLEVGPDGTVYMAGTYDSGLILSGTSLLGVNTNRACFVAAIAPDGTVAFAHAIIGEVGCDTPAIAPRAGGGVVVVGQHEGTLAVDASNVLGAADQSGGFLLELDENGVMVGGATSLDGQGNEAVTDVALTEGTTVVTGSYQLADFTIAGQNLNFAEGTEGFVANLDVPWAEAYSGPSFQSARGVVARPDGSVVVRLRFNGNVTVGGTDYSTNGFGWLLAAYTHDGQFIWADDEPTGATALIVNQLAVGTSGGVYVSGSFQGPLAFDNLPTLTPPDNSPDGLVVARGADGIARWALSATGTGNDDLRALAVDCRGYVWVAGGYAQEVAVGDLTATGNASSSAFVARLLH